MPEAREPAVDLLPARMLNEFVYCPRLFFYEHVEGVFVHNADTRRGARDHERVDGGKGELPAAKKKKQDEEEPETEDDSAGDAEAKPDNPEIENRESKIENADVIHSRSVMLGSESLGVVAKLDLVEVTLEQPTPPNDLPLFTAGPRQAARVCPVEYKAGAPRDGATDGAPDLWDTDRMQLGLQILLLRENGYACDEGVIFYRQTRQRVRYLLTAEDEAWICRTIGLARTCAGGPIPAPLDHSPKCPRCSLVSVCLPDETRLLRDAPDAEMPTEAQLGLPGFLLEEGTVTDAGALADALATDEPAWDNLPEPQMPRQSLEGGVRRLIAPDIDTKALYVRRDPVIGNKLSGVIGYTFLCLVEVDLARGFRSGGAMEAVGRNRSAGSKRRFPRCTLAKNSSVSPAALRCRPTRLPA